MQLAGCNWRIAIGRVRPLWPSGFWEIGFQHYNCNATKRKNTHKHGSILLIINEIGCDIVVGQHKTGPYRSVFTMMVFTMEATSPNVSSQIVRWWVNAIGRVQLAGCGPSGRPGFREIGFQHHNCNATKHKYKPVGADLVSAHKHGSILLSINEIGCDIVVGRHKTGPYKSARATGVMRHLLRG